VSGKRHGILSGNGGFEVETARATQGQVDDDSSMKRGRRLVDKLLGPSAYPFPVAAVRLIETHCAWVLLTGQFVFKIKKPVNFGFLDYSTLEKRRFYCEEEVRLNKRFAPEIYLDVVAVRGDSERPHIEGDGPVLEYAVRMRQFADNGLLSQCAEQKRLDATHVDQMIRIVAEFHQGAEQAGNESPFGEPDRIHHYVVENFDHIRPFVSGSQVVQQLHRIERWVTEARTKLDGLLRDRKRNGFIRECHGDLHLGNLTLIDGQVTLFDCIEFNPELRWIDVISEVAFLVMDLQERGYRAFASRFLNGYLQETGDYQGLALLRYYLVYRAMVRAKVAILRRQQTDRESAAFAQADDEFRKYTQLAEDYTQPLHPMLLITYGLSGSGKTTVARQLAELRGTVQIRSDVERKRLAGLAALDKSGAQVGKGLYTAGQTEQTYQRLAELADAVLATGYSVVVDATFLKRDLRERFRALAETRGVPFAILDCEASDQELRRRVRLRAAREADASEATLEVLDYQLKSREEPAAEELAATIRVDTASSDYIRRLTQDLDRYLKPK